MTTAVPTTALATIQPAFTDAERLALAGSLAGYRGLTREAYALDLRQFTTWCRARSLSLFAVRRPDIESFARELEARGRARATVTRRLSTIAGFYRYAVEEELLDHSPAWRWQPPGGAACSSRCQPPPRGDAPRTRTAVLGSRRARELSSRWEQIWRLCMSAHTSSRIERTPVRHPFAEAINSLANRLGSLGMRPALRLSRHRRVVIVADSRPQSGCERCR